MSAPIFVERDGHRTWLKWHRARRRGSDPVFTGTRIREGLAAGASVEVDLVVHGDRGFAVLHDLTLGRETTGGGRVADLSAAALRGERIRDNNGRPTDEPVMLLEDLSALVAGTGVAPDALLQLDYKEDAAALDDRAIASFAVSVEPVARHMILSSGDAESVRLLSDAAPGVRVGYDPCHDGALDRLAQGGDFMEFVANALEASPRAEMIYLGHPLVTGAAEAGFDIVGAFHAADRRIDAYTIKAADAAGVALAEQLLAFEVDQITTDDPEGLARALGSS